MFDGEAFGQQMVEIVRGYVAAEIDPLRAENKAQAEVIDALTTRVAELEFRAAEPPENSVTASDFTKWADDFLANLPTPEPGKDGADCDMDAVRVLIDEKVADAVAAGFAALPVPKDGEPGAKGDPGVVDMEAVRELVDGLTQQAVSEQLAEAIAALPAPAKGEKGDPGDKGDKGDPGKDGTGLADALIDRDGNLVLTMADGMVKQLGKVIGRDGKDGDPGKDGKTFTLDDFDIVAMDDPRDYKFCFTTGETMHSFELEMPGFVDKGVWRDTDAYRKGDGVTWAGSFWIAQRDNPAKPDTADGGWRLAAKKGRDGKDASK